MGQDNSPCNILIRRNVNEKRFSFFQNKHSFLEFLTRVSQALTSICAVDSSCGSFSFSVAWRTQRRLNFLGSSTRSTKRRKQYFLWQLQCILFKFISYLNSLNTQENPYEMLESSVYLSSQCHTLHLVAIPNNKENWHREEIRLKYFMKIVWKN